MESYPVTSADPRLRFVHHVVEVARAAMRRAPLRHRSAVPPPTSLEARPGSRGQSLVEFALVLMPLLVVLLGIIQFGFIFNSYVTLTNAVREGAREGTIYQYDRTCSKAQNDALRNEAIVATVLSSLNLLSHSAPQFTTSSPSGTGCGYTSTWTSTTSSSKTTYTNGDLNVSYDWTGLTDNDPRTGEKVTVSATYHQDLIIPLVANLLPKDAGGRLGLGAQVTMVIN